jgi:hypothetical protein
MGERKKDRDQQTPSKEEHNQEAPADADDQSDTIPPHPRKVGESSENLRRREEWFRKKTGAKP